MFTSSAFAVNCTDPSSGITRAATSTEYVGPTGKCQPCGEPYYAAKFNSSYVTSSCGNGTLVCKNSGYKMIWNVDYYVCFNCPHASNGNKLGLPTSYNQFNNYSWSPRCIITKFGEPGTNGTVKKTYKPTQQCISWRVFTYETTPDYDRDIMSDADINCPWEEVSSVYENCDAGYHLSGTGAGNSCVMCPAGTYYGGGDATSCHECPWDAVMPTGNVTSPEGSTSASQCYYPGSSGGSQTDTSGTYTYGGNCFLDVTSDTFLMHLSFDNCNDWNLMFDSACGTYCGPVVQGWGDCKNACLYNINSLCYINSSNTHNMLCTLSNASAVAEGREFYLYLMNHLPASANCYATSVSIAAD